MRCVETTTVKYCSAKTTTHFLFEQVITRFGCPRILMSDRGTHFINSTIKAMTEEFEVSHQNILFPVNGSKQQIAMESDDKDSKQMIMVASMDMCSQFKEQRKMSESGRK
jgi:hypothetical protein